MLVTDVVQVIDDFRFRWCSRFVVAPFLIAPFVLLTLYRMSEASHPGSLEPVCLMDLAELACLFVSDRRTGRTGRWPPVKSRPTGRQGMLTVFPWHLFEGSGAETGEYHNPV